MKRLLSLLLTASMLVSLPVYSRAEDDAHDTAVHLTDNTSPAEENDIPARNMLTREELREREAILEENRRLRASSSVSMYALNSETDESGTFGDGFTWSLKAGVLTLSGEGLIPDLSNRSYPWYPYRGQIRHLVIGKDITYIPNRVILNLYNITGFTAEEGSLAYSSADGVLYDREKHVLICYPPNLEEENFTIPSTVQEIGENAMADAYAIVSMTIPASVISIPQGSLPAWGNLEEITVAADNPAYSSADGVLYDKIKSAIILYPPEKSESSFAIPETVTQIYTDGLVGNPHLTSVTVPAATVELGYYPFHNCRNLASVTVAEANSVFASADGVLFSEEMDMLYLYPPAKAGSTYTIPASVEYVSSYAFSDCQTLNTLSIPSGTTYLDYNAISVCSALTAISVDAENPEYSSSDGVLFDKTGRTLIHYPSGSARTSYTVPSGTEVIASEAFGYVTALTSLTLPASVTNVNSGAVWNCPALTEIRVQGSPVWEENAVTLDQACTIHGLTGSRTEIFAGEYGFDFVSTGTYTPVVIASGSLSDTIAWSFDSIGNLSITGSGDIPDDCVGLDEYLSSVVTITIGDGISSIPEDCFWSCRSLQSAVIPASVTYIARDAFYNRNAKIIAENGTYAKLFAQTQGFRFECSAGEPAETALASGSFGDAVSWFLTDIGRLTLNGTGALPELTYENTVPWDNYNDYIVSVVIGDGITSVGEYIFSQAYSLTDVTLPASVTYIYPYAFYDYNDGNLNITAPDGSEGEIHAKAHGYVFRCSDSEDKLNVYASGTCGSDITWTLYDSAELVVSGTGELGDFDYSPDYGWEDYPYHIGKATVSEGITMIGSEAFYSMELLSSVSLPSTLTSIGRRAFYYCKNLTSFTVPKNVTEIGDRAFDSCYNMTGIYVEDGNTAYVSDGGVLMNYDRTEIISYPSGRQNTAYVIPEGITYLADNVFSSSNLRTVTIPASLTEIDNYTAFRSLERILVNENNPSYCSDDHGVLYSIDRSILYMYPGNSAETEYTVPDTVETIWDNAFGYAYNLDKIILHKNVTEFGENVFESYRDYVVHCWDNTPAERYVKAAGVSYNIIDGDKVNLIAEGSCGDSVTWSLTDEGILNISGTGAMQNFHSTSPWYDHREIIRTAVVSEGVTTLGNYAFSSAQVLTSVTLPSTLTSIGNHAFENCRNLESLELPASLTTLGQYVFRNCYDITLTVNPANTSFSMDGCVLYSGNRTVLELYLGSSDDEEFNIADTVTEIKSSVFVSSNSSLKTITIPASVEKIGTNAFTNVYSLTDLYIYAYDISFGNYAFSDSTGLTVHVYDGSDAEVYAKNLRNITLDVMDGDKTNEIDGGNLTETVSWSLSDDGTLTISGTGDMPDYGTETQTPWYRPYQTNIKKIVVSDGITRVGSYAFRQLSKVTEVSIADSVTSIGQYAFYDLYEVTELILPKNLTSVEAYAFTSMKLTSLTIPASVTSFSRYALSSIYSLTSITVEEGNTAYCAVDNVLFSADKTVLHLYLRSNPAEEYIIPDTVTTIQNSAFAYNDNIRSIVIPASVKNILEDAFSGCDSLSSLTVYSTDAQWGYDALWGCSDDLAVTAYDGSTAEYYAKEEGYTFIPIGGVDNPNEILSGSCGESAAFRLMDDGTLTISGTGAMTNYTGSGQTPWADVKSKVKKIVIEEGITHVGNYAFYYMSSCTDLSLPSTLTTIGSYAFYQNYRLTELTLPDNVVSIGESAFYSCNGLKTISLGKSFASFGVETFTNLSALESISVSPLNTTFHADDGILFGNNILYLFPQKSAITEYTIPEGITTIAEKAIYYCSNLTSLIIPEHVTKLDRYAVYSCYNLSDVTVYTKTAEFGNYAIYYVADDFVLTAHDGSTAEFYAKEHGLTFRVFDGEEDLPNTVASGKIGTAITWTLSDTGVLTVSGTGQITDYGSYSSNPWYYDYRMKIKSLVIEEGITRIGTYAFSYLGSITDVSLPSTLTAIGNYAFYETSTIATIDIPAGVTEIGYRALYGIDALSAVNVAAENTVYASIDGVLYDKALTTLMIYPPRKTDASYTAPDTLTTVSSYAFDHPRNLTSITLPASLSSVEQYGIYYWQLPMSLVIYSEDAVYHSSACSGTYSRMTITAHDGSTAEFYAKEKGIAFQVFEGEEDLPNTIDSGVCGENLSWELLDSGELRISGTGAMTDYSSSGAPWYTHRNKIISITVEDGVTSIGSYAFYSCGQFTSITLADSITSIGDRAFQYCYKLESIELPASLTTLGRYVFLSCSAFASVTVDSANTVFASADGVLYSKDMTEVILYPPYKTNTSFTLPDSVTKIREYAFYDLRYLTSLTLPAGVTTLEASAVSSNSCLTDLKIDAMTTEFASNAVTSSSSAFVITVHDGSDAEKYAKENGFTIAYFDGESDTVGTVASGEFGEGMTWTLDENYCLTISGDGDMPEWTSSSAVPWYEYRSKILSVVIEEGITSVAPYAFYYAGKMQTVSLADSITIIGTHAFYSCSSLRSITMPENLAAIADEAFYEARYLEEIIFNDSLETIGSEAFYYNYAMTTLRLPASLTSIGNQAFYGWSYLENIVAEAGGSAYSSQDGILYDADKTTLVLWPQSSPITEYTVPSTVTAISDYASYNVYKLQSIVLPEGLETVGRYNLYSCDKLTSATVYSCDAEYGYNTFRSNTSGFTVYGYEDSTIADYCGSNSITFSALAEEDRPDDLSVKFTVAQSVDEEASPISGAMVYVTSEDGSVDKKRTTGTSGVVSMDLEDGTYTVQVYKKGYVLRTFLVEITSGNREFTVYLNTESILQVQTTVTEITRDEAIAAGVDIAADENRQIYQCTAVLEFVPRYTYYCIEDTVVDCQPIHHDGMVIQPVAKDVFLIVYSEVAWLKEMFKVELIAANTSANEVLEDVSAAISLPDGVSLAVMTEEIGQQSTTADLGDIDPQSQKNHAWYLTGDQKGEYYLNGIVSGTRVGGGISEDLSVGFTTETPITVLAGDAMHLTITAERYAAVGEVYRMKYKLENTSDKTLYDVSLNVMGGRFLEEYDVSEEDFEYTPEVEGGPELSGTFAHGYTLSDTEFKPGEYLSGIFEIVFGTGIDPDHIEYMLADFFTVTGKGSTAEIPTTLEIVDKIDTCVWNREITTEPTCTEPGMAVLTCTDCGVKAAEMIPSLGHSWETDRTVDTPATCTGEGESSYHCIRCDERTGVTTLPALGHNYVWTYDSEPTCEEGGHGTGVCSRCGNTVTEDLPALGHDWSEWNVTAEPTCEVNGSREKTCSRCSVVIIETISPLGHSWSEWNIDIEVECETPGQQSRECSVCGKTETEEIPAPGHAWTGWTVEIEATCTENGKEIRECTVCHLTESAEIPMLGHEWGEWEIIEKTCTVNGTETRTCGRCGEIEQIIDEATGHVWDEGVCTRYPTLTETGIMLYTCTVCGETREEVLPVAQKQEAIFAPSFPDGDNTIIYQYGEEESFYIEAMSFSIQYPVITYTSSDEEVATVDEWGEVFIHNVGETTITARIERNIAFVEAEVSYRLIVTKAPLTITVSDAEISYGDQPVTYFPLTYEGFVYNDNASVLEGEYTYICDYKQYDNAGEYEVTCTELSARNYEITYVPGTLTVHKAKDHTITLTGLTQSRAGLTPIDAEIVPQDKTAQIAVEYLVNGAWSTGLPTDAGRYEVRASLAASENIEVTGEFFTGILTVEKTGLTVTADDCEIFYGDSWTADSEGYTADGFLYGDDISVLEGTFSPECSYRTLDKAGTYPITGSGLTSKNYDITYVPGTLTVKKAADHTITLSGLTQKYSELLPVTAEITPADSTAFITVEYLVDGEWSTELPASSGEFEVRAFLSSSDNIEVTGKIFTDLLTVEKSVLTVTANDMEIFYGEEWDESLASFTAEGFTGGDTIDTLAGIPVFSCGYTLLDPAGDYEITVSGVTSEDYEIVFVPGTLTVKKADQHTITLGNLTQRRGETAPVTTVISPADPTAQILTEYCCDGIWSASLPDAVGDFEVRASLTSSDNIEVTEETFTAVLTIKAGASIGGEEDSVGVEIVDHGTHFEVLVPDDAIEDIIASVPESGELVVDVLSNEGAAEAKELVLPGNLLNEAASNDAVESVTITADNTEITMTSGVLETIAKNTETTDKVSFRIDDVSEDDMTAEQQKAVQKFGTNTVLLELTMIVQRCDENGEVVDEEYLHKFGGYVDVRAAYELDPSMEGQTIIVCHVDETGKPSYSPAKYYDGYVVFSTNHFSYFVIATVEAEPVRGNVNMTGTVDEDDLALLRDYFAGRISYLPSEKAADINGNGRVDRADQMILARYLAGWDGYAEMYFSHISRES